MAEEKKQKEAKKDNFDINKARKIVLELIGENESAEKGSDSRKINNEMVVTKEPVNVPDLPLKSFSEKKKSVKIPAKQGVNTELNKKITLAKPSVIKITKEKNILPRTGATEKIKKEDTSKQNKRQHKLTRIAFISLFSGVLFFALYCAFTILIIRFNIDNKITRKIANYLPVPAYFSSDKIIEYYEFKDIIKKSTNGDEEEIKSKLVTLIFGDNPEEQVWSLVD